ncbi:hypothetical protein B0H65DRAFT_539808 [Neurospora tetraspora]|uniref:Cyanovirin-N domain-containing protein n=1 Tax=Neurospora tetraspora TaxID=94610 RepID=A0AAE0JFS5_9PEZI|nr:hypothetical protein B0H65DRAFT_539808 [Neurospora tetraspora]
MHRSLFWGSCLSLFLPLCILSISYIAGTSALPQYAPPGAQATNGLYSDPGNFTGTCHDINFDDNQCVLSAKCSASTLMERESKLNLNKCLFYAKFKPDYDKDKDGKVANYNVDQHRFRPGSFCDKSTCESCRLADGWTEMGGPKGSIYLVCKCRKTVGDPATQEVSSWIWNEIFNTNGDLTCFGEKGV